MTDPLSGIIDEINKKKAETEADDIRAEKERGELASLPSIEELCVSFPLYSKIKTVNRVYLKALRGEPIQFDAYCTSCGRDATFKDNLSRGSGSGATQNKNWMLTRGRFNVVLFCQRANHMYSFYFDYSGDYLIKCGQMPSLEDIAGHDIRKYEAVLRDGYFDELKRATGLASHGIGIGSFVYLRRIFEKLIHDHHRSFVHDHGEIEGFAAMRMDEKIGALTTVLPPALVKNKSTYGILSSGIHSLDEETCRVYFPVVRAAIIQILEQDLRAREELKAGAQLETAIAKLAGEVKALSKGGS